MTTEQIAVVCHEANKAYCEQIGDMSQKSWTEAEQWQRDSAIKGVQYRLDNPTAPQSAQHEAWCRDKVADGWKYGSVKNPEIKEHPCLVDYKDLPEDQRRKDALFQGVVDALTLNNGAVMGIPVQDYADLKKNEAWLRSLEGAGVDNWKGYSHAQDSFKENYPEYQQ